MILLYGEAVQLRDPSVHPPTGFELRAFSWYVQRGVRRSFGPLRPAFGTYLRHARMIYSSRCSPSSTLELWLGLLGSSLASDIRL